MHPNLSAMNARQSNTLRWCIFSLAVLFFVISSTRTKPDAPATASASLDGMRMGGFPGEYADPNHPNCKRSIESTVDVDANDNDNAITVSVSGTDGNPGCPPDGSGEAWQLSGSVDGDTIVVDFSPKGGPENLTGRKIEGGILWEDQNVWTTK